MSAILEDRFLEQIGVCWPLSAFYPATVHVEQRGLGSVPTRLSLQMGVYRAERLLKANFLLFLRFSRGRVSGNGAAPHIFLMFFEVCVQKPNLRESVKCLGRVSKAVMCMSSFVIGNRATC